MATNNGWNNQIASSKTAITLNSGTNALSISNDAANTTVDIATGSAAKIVTLGSTNGASRLALQTGTADFSLTSATGTIISALDTGQVTKPLQSAFAAYNSTSPTNVTGDGTFYTAPFDTEQFDVNSDFASNTFTAPVTGKYKFNVTIAMSNLTAAHNVTSIFLTTSSAIANYISGYDGGGLIRASDDKYIMSTACFISLTAGNTVYVRFSVFSSTKTITMVGGLGYTSFSGYLVC